MVDRFEKFSFYITECAKLLSRIEEAEMERYGLKGPYAIYLLAIERQNGEITSAKLAEVARRDKADVSRALRVMEERGIIERHASGVSNYRAAIALTDFGNEIVGSVRKKARDAVEYASHNVPRENIKLFYSSLESFYENIRTMSESGVPKSPDR